MYPEISASSLLDTGFLDTLPNAETVPNFEVAAACFSCSPHRFEFIKIKFLWSGGKQIIFKNYEIHYEAWSRNYAMGSISNEVIGFFS
jgi:hypothetical protein